MVDNLSALCVSRCNADGGIIKTDDETDHEFDNLVQEIVRLMCDCGVLSDETILVSVLESLKLHLPTFTLSSVQAEVQIWWLRGETL